MTEAFTSPEIDKIATALGRVQSTLKNVVKDAKNPHFKNNYATLTACLDAIKKPLLENGLSFSQPMENSSVVTILMHESGQWIKSKFDLPMIPTLSAKEVQAFCSAISYARRYSIASIVGIGTEDDDGEGIGSSPPKQADRISVQGKFAPARAPVNSSPVSVLRDLCEQEDIDFVSFGLFHKLDSKNSITITNSIENFDDYVDKYKIYLDSKNN